MGEMRNAYSIWFVSLKGRDGAENLGVDGKIILKWMSGKWMGRCGLNSSGSG
jgi:hypothetical protein